MTGLRNYLLGGGFLMVDDFWGAEDWESLRAELRRVFPNREPVELSTDHEIFRSFYEFNETPQVPSLFALQQPDTRESTAAEPHYFGLLDDTGRLMALLCHNSDFGDAWGCLGTGRKSRLPPRALVGPRHPDGCEHRCLRALALTRQTCPSKSAPDSATTMSPPSLERGAWDRSIRPLIHN